MGHRVFGHIFLFLILIDLKSISYNIVLHVSGTSTSILSANFSFVEPSTCMPEDIIEGATVPIEDVVLNQGTSMFNSNTMNSFIFI